MNKILITGGAGFIGSNLAESYVKDGDQVTIVDNLSMGLKKNIPDSDLVKFYEKDITDHEFMEKLLVENNFDYIYLVAAVASVADSVERPYFTHQTNQEANVFIFETIRKNHLTPKRILFTSSAAIYGNEPTLPKTEDSKIEPLTPYAVDKFASERYAMVYHNLYNINATATRFFNVYGPRQNPSSPYSGVMSIITDSLMNNKGFTLFGDGEQIRDFTYVDDVVAAMKLLSTNDDAIGEAFNVATGHSISLNEIISNLEKISGIKLEVTKKEARAGDIKLSSASIDKLKKLGYRPNVSLDEGLTKYWNSLNK